MPFSETTTMSSPGVAEIFARPNPSLRAAKETTTRYCFVMDGSLLRAVVPTSTDQNIRTSTSHEYSA